VKNYFIYRITISKYSFLRIDVSIEEARAWARKAFPKERPVVRREATKTRLTEGE
jgi:hypothetical protein